MSRSGDTIKLMELLDEAKERAQKTLEERIAAVASKVKIEKEDIPYVADILSCSSIKYFDLRQSRKQNYVFSFDKMLDPKGNTGVYLIFAYCRIISIIAKSAYGADEALQKAKEEAKFTLTHPLEKELALCIL